MQLDLGNSSAGYVAHDGLFKAGGLIPEAVGVGEGLVIAVVAILLYAGGISAVASSSSAEI